jgi:phosphoglycolate phosphatase-like HAD superfamily hydrolase
MPTDMTNKRRCRAILFDWDGTLMNTLDIKARNAGRAFQGVLESCPEQVESAYRRHSGRPRRELFDAIAADVHGGPLDEGIYRVLNDAFSKLNGSTAGPDRVFPDVPPALCRLRGMGFALGISSSVPTRELRAAVSTAGLEALFDFVLGSEPGCGKGRGHVEWIRRQNGWKAGDLCFVGDDVADIQLAREAGIPVVARVGTHPREALQVRAPDHIIQSLLELPDILEPDPAVT